MAWHCLLGWALAFALALGLAFTLRELSDATLMLRTTRSDHLSILPGCAGVAVMIRTISGDSKLWRAAVVTVLLYEAAAAVSKGRVPWLTDVVRSMPPVARLACTSVIALAVHDHFSTRRVF